MEEIQTNKNKTKNIPGGNTQLAPNFKNSIIKFLSFLINCHNFF